MIGKAERENYYQKLLEKSHKRHKKFDRSTFLKKEMNWEQLSKHFKTMVYGKNMDGHLERVDATIH